MSNDTLQALVREIRKAAETLPAGKRRDVNNKLDRITLALRSTATVDKTVALTGTAPKRKRIQVMNRAGKTVYVNQYWMENE